MLDNLGMTGAHGAHKNMTEQVVVLIHVLRNSFRW